MDSPCDQNVSAKIGETRPVGCTHGKAAQRSSKDWSDYTSDLAGSRICVEPAELFEIAVDREEVRVLGLLPRKPAQFKRGYENK